jgi:tetratricopeptide (TPR) repeat protein
LKQGVYAYRAAKYEEALGLFRESESLFATFKEIGGVADALRYQGLVLGDTTRLDDAAIVLERANAMIAPLNYVRLGAHIQNALSTVYRLKGDLDRAGRLAEQSLAFARESGDRTVLSASLTGLGAVVRLKGDYPRARGLYEEAARTADAIGEVRTRNAAINNSANIDFMLGDLTSARKKFEAILIDDRKIRNNAGIALRLGNLSRVLTLQDELVEAEKLNAEECAVQESLKAKVNLAWCRTRLAQIWIELDRKADAEALAKQITIADFGSAVTAPVFIARLARLHLVLGHRDAAVAAIDAAEKLQSKAGPIEEQAIQVSIIRAEVEAAQGKRAAAIARLNRAIADADKRGLVTWSLDAKRVLSRLGSS